MIINNEVEYQQALIKRDDLQQGILLLLKKSMSCKNGKLRKADKERLNQLRAERKIVVDALKAYYQTYFKDA